MEQSTENPKITELLKEYLSTRLELGRLTIIERAVIIIANLVTDTFVLTAIILSFLFGSVTLAFYLAEELGSFALGFLSVTGLYMFLGILMYFTKDRYVEKYLINFMIKRILRNKRITTQEN